MDDDEPMSLIKHVPSFAQGFNLLLLHDDTLALNYLSSLLESYSFKVTPVDSTSTATSMICKPRSKFKVIMAKATMPDMNALSFLDLVLKKNIPTIFIYSRPHDEFAEKALATGLCYFLHEPIHPNDLKYVWQHVYSTRETHEENSKACQCHSKALQRNDIKQVEEVNEERKSEEKKGKLKEKRIVDDIQRHGDNENEKINHDDARPKQILTWMKEPCLTVRQVASHLQKYKSRLKRHEDDNNFDFPLFSSSSCLGSKLQLPPSPFGMSSLGTTGIQAPPASLNNNQNQIQFQLNNSQNQNQFCMNNSQNQNLVQMNDSQYHNQFQMINHQDQDLFQMNNSHYQNLSQMNNSQNQNMFEMNNSQNQNMFQMNNSQNQDLFQMNNIQDQNQFQMNNHVETEESNILKLHEAQGNPTKVTNCVSQSLGSSMDQNQHVYEDVLKMLVEEDYDNVGFFENGTSPSDLDQYCEMLRTILDEGNSSPQEFYTMTTPTDHKGLTEPSNGNIFK
ncbi:hypothetical protein RJT34_25480 [Clitoria ternatea]|uniref:Response regulatory domain-containing protein n=1 Tax=Clitoria ternatea TaxID=43366 RepID=A0AAN9FSQ9_CLITE